MVYKKVVLTPQKIKNFEQGIFKPKIVFNSGLFLGLKNLFALTVTCNYEGG